MNLHTQDQLHGCVTSIVSYIPSLSSGRPPSWDLMLPYPSTPTAILELLVIFIFNFLVFRKWSLMRARAEDPEPQPTWSCLLPSARTDALSPASWPEAPWDRGNSEASGKVSSGDTNPWEPAQPSGDQEAASVLNLNTQKSEEEGRRRKREKGLEN